MKRAKTQEEKYRQMMEMPVSRLIPGLAVPTIISMLITSIYNMADTFFVSQLGTSASGAVGVIFSAMAIIQALGFGFGQGAGINISQSLGNKDTAKAGEAAAASFFAVLFLGIVIGVVGNLFLHPLVMMLGATPTLRGGLRQIHSHRISLYDVRLRDEQCAAFPGKCCLRHGGNHHRRNSQHDSGSHFYFHL